MMLRASPFAEAPGRMNTGSVVVSTGSTSPIGGGRPTSSVNRSPNRASSTPASASWVVPRARPDQEASSWVPSAVCVLSSIRSERPTRSPTGLGKTPTSSVPSDSQSKSV